MLGCWALLALPSPAAVPPHDPPIAADEEREVPDYDGRGDDPITAADVLVWVPRTVFSPLYLLTEYGIRQPLGAFMRWFERTPSTDPFWTFGHGHKSGLVPSALLDFGFRPSIGIYFYSDDAFVRDLGLRSHVAFGGPRWFRGTAAVGYTIDRETLDHDLKLVQLKGIYSHRPDWLFYGLGPESDDENVARYEAHTVEATFKYEGGFWRSSRVIAWAGIRHADFIDQGCCGELTIGEAVAAGIQPALPPLFEDGYFVARTGVDVSVDTRREPLVDVPEASDWQTPDASGVKIAAHLEISGGLKESRPARGEEPSPPAYAHYGGTLGGFVDLWQHRVLGLELFVDLADPFDEDNEVPFTELVTLGGSRPMRGFLERRLMDRSAAVATLEYMWPIWVYLDGSMHYAVGNVFGERFESFDLGLLRQSFGVGFRGTGARDHVFELLVAFGTHTFDRGGRVDDFRLVIGASENFPLETK
jgi:hypothetical protein